MKLKQRIGIALIAAMCGSLLSLAGGASASLLPETPAVIYPLATTITHKTQPVVSIKAPLGSTITVYEGLTAVGSANGGGNAPAQLTLSPLSPGVHSLTARIAPSGEQLALPYLIIDPAPPFDIEDAAYAAALSELKGWDLAGPASGTGSLGYRNAKFLMQSVDPAFVLPTLIDLTAGPGSAVNTVKLSSALPRLYVEVSDAAVPQPHIGEPVPTWAYSYTAGQDITEADPLTYKYVGVYAANMQGEIAAFAALELRPSDFAGTVQGEVMDDQTHSAVSGISLRFREGSDNRSGPVLADTITAADGSYSVPLPAGTYTAEISGAGYVTSYVTAVFVHSEQPAPENKLVAIRTPAGEEIRVVLHWGSVPRDLDSHLLGPKPDGGSFHIYYANKAYQHNSTVYATLDLDDTNGEGPETTTLASVTQEVYGTYTFYVKNYSNEHGSSLAESGATVDFYQGGSASPAYTFNVPAHDTGMRYWHVFDLSVDASGAHFVPQNTLQSAEPTYAEPSPALVGSATELSDITSASATSAAIELLDNGKTGLTIDDFVVTTSVFNQTTTESYETKVTGLAYDADTRTFTFDPIPMAADEEVELIIAPSAVSKLIDGLPVRKLLTTN